MHSVPETFFHSKGLDHPQTVGISEFSGFSVISRGKELLEAMDICSEKKLSLQDHLAGISGRNPTICVAAGVADDTKRVQVTAIRTESCTLVTSPVTVWLNVKNGIVQCDPDQDILYIAQVERHGKNGRIGKAFMSGFGLKSGAIVCSIGHDNHNIIVLGTNFEDMALAANRLNDIQGGQIVVKDDQILSEIASGFISDISGELFQKQGSHGKTY